MIFIIYAIIQCAWCPKLNRCSSGMDRNRQEWLINGCEKDDVNIQHPAKCTSLPNNTSTPKSSVSHKDDDMHDDHENDSHDFSDHRHDQPENSQVQKIRTPGEAFKFDF